MLQSTLVTYIYLFSLGKKENVKDKDGNPEQSFLIGYHKDLSPSETDLFLWRNALFKTPLAIAWPAVDHSLALLT
jgi:hypothetical protein